MLALHKDVVAEIVANLHHILAKVVMKGQKLALVFVVDLAVKHAQRVCTVVSKRFNMLRSVQNFLLAESITILVIHFAKLLQKVQISPIYPSNIVVVEASRE